MIDSWAMRPPFSFRSCRKENGPCTVQKKRTLLAAAPAPSCLRRCTGVFRDGAGKTSRPPAGSRRAAWSSSASLAPRVWLLGGKLRGGRSHCLCVSFPLPLALVRGEPGRRSCHLRGTRQRVAKRNARKEKLVKCVLAPRRGRHHPPRDGSTDLAEDLSVPEGQVKSALAPIRRPPSRAEGHCTGARPSDFFSSTGRGAFSFWARPKGAPAAPRAVGRGGARERAQFSPQAETELSGLCDDAMGGAPPWERPPAGADIPRAAGCRPYGSLRSDRPAR